MIDATSRARSAPHATPGPPRIEWRADDQLWIDGTEFRVVPVGRQRSTPRPVPGGEGCRGSVRPYYGTSQAAGDAIAPVLRENFGSSMLDLVVDDASHELDFTRRSFNMLFPLLRPGGLYVIEDWGWGHVPFPRERRGPSLAKLVLQLVLSLPYADGVIDDVTVNRYWAVVRRGAAAIPVPFDIADQTTDRGRQLLSVDDEDPRLR
jgi:hypothetical protein